MRRIATSVVGVRDAVGPSVLVFSDGGRALLGIACFLTIGLVLWLDLPLAVKGVALLSATAVGAAIPAAALGAAIAATPLVFDPVALGNHAFSLLELAILFGGAGIGLRAVWDARRTADRERLLQVLRPWPMTIAVGLLTVAAAISLATLADARYRPESVREFRLVVVEPLLFFGVARWVLLDGGSRRLTAMVLLAVGTVVAGYAATQIVFGSTGVVADGVRRATGPYPHPNNLALFLERAGLLGAALALGRGVRGRWTAVATLLTLLGVGLTFSRGAALAVLIGLAFLLFVQQRARGLKILALVALVMSGLLVVTAGDRIADMGSTGEVSTRVLIWRAAVDMGLDHPVWGVGLDQFLTQYWPRYVDPDGWPERYTAHAHNLILDVWLRLGILGLIASIGIFAAVVHSGIRIVRARRGADPIALGALVLLLTGFVHGMVDNGFFLPDLAVLTWFAIALIERTAPAMPDVSSLDDAMSAPR